MLEGLLRHGTEMEVEKNYVDSGGQSEVGFAFCHLLGFHLLPRLKGIHRQKLYRPLAGHPDAYPHKPRQNFRYVYGLLSRPSTEAYTLPPRSHSHAYDIMRADRASLHTGELA